MKAMSKEREKEMMDDYLVKKKAIESKSGKWSRLGQLRLEVVIQTR